MDSYYSIFITICLILVHSALGHTRNSKNGDLLPYTASFTQTEVSEGRKGCPWPRADPTLLSHKKEIMFDSSCSKTEKALPTFPTRSCPKRPPFCYKEFVIHMRNTVKFAMSILLKTKCSVSARMRLFSWYYIRVNTICGNNQHELEICLPTSKSFYEVPSQAVIFLENITASRVPCLQISINGKYMEPYRKESAYNQQQLHFQTALIMGYNEGFEGAADIASFTGIIKEVNIFRGSFPNRDQEYQRMHLLNMSALYPDCTCQNGSIVSNGEMCRDGYSRFTGTKEIGKYFYHTPALYDGIKNSSLGYGFIEPGSLNELLIKLRGPCMISKFKMYASKIPVALYKDATGTHDWHLLSCGLGEYKGEDVPKQCQTGKIPSSNWTQNGKVWTLEWKIARKVTKALRVILFDDGKKTSLRRAKSDNEANNSIIHEIEIWGRELHKNGRENDYWCFPNNGEKKTNKCGECQCRKGYETLAAPECKPYITDITPKCGPISGDTTLIINGGLLQPSVDYYTSVNISGFRLCEDPIIRNDTHIYCVTRQGDKRLSGLRQRIEITIHVKGVFYTLPTQWNHTFTYLPMPIVTDIFPKRGFLSVAFPVRVIGENFSQCLARDPYYSILLWSKEQGEHVMQCNVLNSTIMECRGTIKQDQLLVEVYINCSFTGCEKYRDVPTITMYQEPNITSCIIIKQSNTESALKCEVCLCLRFLASGAIYSAVGDTQGVDKATVCRSVRAVVSYLNSLQDRYIKWPKRQEFPQRAREFFRISHFPSEIGAVDGTHMPIRNPTKLHNGFYNRKGFTSINVMGSYMMSGCVVEDYKVTINEEECKIMGLSNSSLQCRFVPTVHPLSSKLTIEVTVYNYIYATQLVKSIPTESQKAESNHVLIVSVTFATSAGLFVLILVVIIRKRRSKAFHRLDDTQFVVFRETPVPTPVAMSKSSSMDTLDQILEDPGEFIGDYLLDRSKLKVKEKIFKGTFGRIYRGFIVKEDHVIDVTVKALKDHRRMHSWYVSEFLDETTIMREFSHPNILSLAGVILDDNVCCVLFPYMESDLQRFVSRKRFNLKAFGNMIMDVADGMTFLFRQKFVHCDLAARNCVVDASERVLIADAGLARDIHERDYYRPKDMKRPLPLRWMAPETIETGTYSPQTDVWSFGVVLWEILSQGARPYGHIKNADLVEYLRQNYPLQCPDKCPKNMYDFMTRCWSRDPEGRPKFPEILSILLTIVTSFPDVKDTPALAKISSFSKLSLSRVRSKRIQATSTKAGQVSEPPTEATRPYPFMSGSNLDTEPEIALKRLENVQIAKSAYTLPERSKQQKVPMPNRRLHSACASQPAGEDFMEQL